MAIDKMAMFEGLSKLELAKLLGKLEKATLRAGDILFEQGDPGDRIYIIEYGRLELFILSPEGTRQVLAMLGEGDTLGEMSLFTQEPRSAAAIAVTDLSLFVIDQDTFNRLIEEQAAISRYFIRLMSKRLVATNERLQQSNELRVQRVEAELRQMPEYATELLLWCSEFPTIDEGLIEERFKLTVREFGDRYPELQAYLQPDPLCGGCYQLDTGTRALLYDLATTRYGHQVKRQWAEEAVSYYLDQGREELAVRIWADKGEWSDALARIGAGWSGYTERKRDAILGWLRACPLPLLTAQYSLMLAYLAHCLDAVPEAGIPVLEFALESQAHDYTPQQLSELYEWGARLSEKSGKSRQAMEYLRLAEGMLMASPDADPQRPAEYGYVQARHKLNQYRSKLLVEGAAQLVKGNRLTKLAVLLLSGLMIALFHVIPPIGGLSPQAMAFLGVAVAAVLLWVAGPIPDYIVALGMMAFWVVGDVLEPSVAFSGFASTTWFYMIFIMALSAAVMKSGILYRFALYALKWFPSHYQGQLWGTVIGGLFLNPLIPSSSAKVTLGVPIARTLSESMGFSNRSRGSSGLGLAAMIFYGFTAPFVMTGSYTNMMAFGLAGEAGLISWLQWFLYALPAFVIFCAVILAVMFAKYGKLQAAKPISMEVLDEQLRLIGPMSRRELISVGTVTGSVGLMILQPLHGVDSTWVMLLGFAVLVMTGALDRQTISTGIDWTFLLFLGVAFGFASGVNALGITDALSVFLGQHLSAATDSPYIFLLSVILVSFAVTLVIRDDPAVILLVTALTPLAGLGGIDPWILVFVILLSTDPFFFSYQSPTYLTAYYSSEGLSFTHRQGQRMALLYAAAVMAAVMLSIPYWTWIGLIAS